MPPGAMPVHVAPASRKPDAGFSVIDVEVDDDASVCVAPVTPTPGVVVVMVWEAHPLVPTKVNVPTLPLLTFVSVSVGSLTFVKVHAMFAPAAVAAALRVRVLPASVAVPPGPMPVQVTPAST